MFTKVVLICLAVVFFRDFGNANVVGLAITCKSPPVYTGDGALVTCDFNLPVSTTRPAHFAVDFYPEGSTSPVEIAECTNLPGADLDCKAKRQGETFRISEDPEKLVFEINETSTNHAGRYMCKLSTPIVDPPQLEPCRLTVSDRPRASDGRRPSTRGYPSSSPSMEVTRSPVNKSGVNWVIVGSAIGGAVFVILLICLVIFIVKRMKHVLPQEYPTPAPVAPPANTVLTTRDETIGREETDALISENKENQNVEEGAVQNQLPPKKRKMSEEVETRAVAKQYAVQQKMKKGEFPFDGSLEDPYRRTHTENI